MRPRPFRPGAVVAALACAAIALAGCQSSGESRTLNLVTLNASGVTGTVVLTDQRDGRTRVAIEVAHGGNLDMPAHIHPGTCDALVPQPKYPLENVRDGRSVTVVPAAFIELASTVVAVNIHRSVDDLKTYTACADL